MNKRLLLQLVVSLLVVILLATSITACGAPQGPATGGAFYGSLIYRPTSLAI